MNWHLATEAQDRACLHWCILCINRAEPCRERLNVLSVHGVSHGAAVNRQLTALQTLHIDRFVAPIDHHCRVNRWADVASQRLLDIEG